MEVKKKMKVGVIGMILSVIAGFFLPILWIYLGYGALSNLLTLLVIFGFLISLGITLYYWFKKD